MIASVGAQLGTAGAIVVLALFGVAIAVILIGACRSAAANDAGLEQTAGTPFDRDLAAVLREAVERAELRRQGVLPLAPRDRQREQIEDDLLRTLDLHRRGAA